jgi:tRNA(fMet)-specific endonuclease VapC
MLDTNALSDFADNPRGSVAKRIKQVGETSVCTSSIVAAELRYGTAKKGSSKILARVSTALKNLEIIPFEPPADMVYGELRASLERQGQTMGAMDTLIAAHALSLGYTLVSDDGDFDRVEGLLRENWVR